MFINSFSTNVSLLYPLETSENIQFSDVSRGYRNGTFFENELNNSQDNGALLFYFKVQVGNSLKRICSISQWITIVHGPLKRMVTCLSERVFPPKHQEVLVG